jgi:YggT family protein
LPHCGTKVKQNAAEGIALWGLVRYQQLSLVVGALDMTSLLQILLMILNIAQFIIFAHIIMSWLINFQVLNLRQPLVSQIWDGLNRILDPVYSRVRSYLPSNLGIDFAPLIVLLCVFGLRIVLINNTTAFS